MKKANSNKEKETLITKSKKFAFREPEDKIFFASMGWLVLLVGIQKFFGFNDFDVPVAFITLFAFLYSVVYAFSFVLRRMVKALLMLDKISSMKAKSVIILYCLSSLILLFMIPTNSTFSIGHSLDGYTKRIDIQPHDMIFAAAIVVFVIGSVFVRRVLNKSED